MSKFDDFLDAVKDGLKPLVKDFAAQAKSDAIDSMKTYLAARAADLKSWTSDLAEGKMTRLEFEDLVVSMKSEAQIRALRVAGVQTARLQRLRNALIDLVLDKAIGTFLPG